MTTDNGYGQGNTTFKAVGAEKGLRKLVEDFYLVMSTQPRFAPLRAMHPQDLGLSIDKLYCFLSGWMGGERLYSQRYGAINIPQAHAHLTIGSKEKQMWLDCMDAALARQSYPDELKVYLIQQLEIPAERIRQASQNNLKKPS